MIKTTDLAIDLQFRNSGFDVLDVLIGDNVWIGAKVSILPGVEIGSNCVIGAGSVRYPEFFRQIWS